MSIRRVFIGFVLAGSVAGCPRETSNLRHQVKSLEHEKAVAEAKAHRLEAESKAKDASVASVTSLLNEVGDRLESIQHEQHDLVVLTTTPGVEGTTSPRAGTYLRLSLASKVT